MGTAGICGRVLRIDLTTGRITRERPEASVYRTCYGGRALIAYILLHEVPAETDALAPGNRLVFANGPLTGAPVSGSGRNSVGAKSPLTGGYGDAEVGGYWGAEMKRAGYDALIVEGRSPTPIWIRIAGDTVEIRDATALWGKPTGEVEAAIRAELDDRAVRVTPVLVRPTEVRGIQNAVPQHQTSVVVQRSLAFVSDD